MRRRLLRSGNLLSGRHGLQYDRFRYRRFGLPGMRVPLYVLTPLMKLDMRPLRGFVRRLVNNNTREKMKTAGFTEQELEQVDFDCPELLPVGADMIRAFITEQGVIPAQSMFERSVKYAEFLAGGND